MNRSMIETEKSFPVEPVGHESVRQQFAAWRSVLWGNEHMHAGLTASALLLAGVVRRWAGLSIAPIGCVVFAFMLLAADVRAQFGKHD